MTDLTEISVQSQINGPYCDSVLTGVYKISDLPSQHYRRDGVNEYDSLIVL